jgi:hypothetical protein
LETSGFWCCARHPAEQHSRRAASPAASVRGCTCPESRAMGASAARMVKRSGHAVSRGQDGRGERPATGHGQPRTVIEVMTAAIGAGLQRRERDPKANVRRRGTGSPEPPPQRQPCVCGYSSTSSATVM